MAPPSSSRLPRLGVGAPDFHRSLLILFVFLFPHLLRRRLQRRGAPEPLAERSVSFPFWVELLL